MKPTTHVSAERTSREYDAHSESVATVSDGEVFTVEAVSLLNDANRDLPTTYETLKIPVSGPVHIRGVQPGQRVRIDILDIEIANAGAMVTLPGHGLFGDRVGVSGRVVPIIGKKAVFAHDLRIPIAPMVGKIALAPSASSPPSSTVGDYGGNMDNQRLGIGASIYLIAEVEGGQLYLGDLHACQADGESSLTAVEVSGVVTIRVSTTRSLPIKVPVVVTGQEVMTIGSGETLEEAAKQAGDTMLTLLTEERGWSLDKGAMALSLIGDIGICQLVNPRVSARMAIPAQYLPSLRISEP